MTTNANTFRLGVHPSSVYAERFDAGVLRVEPATRFSPQLGVATIAADDREFEIWLPHDGTSVAARHIELAKSVLANVVEMDDEARAIPDIIDSDEELAYIRIDDEGATFTYFATTVNSEWDVQFVHGQSGAWVCNGIKPRA